MSLVSLKEVLQDARRACYAVPMFDVSNAAMIRAAVEVAEEENSPVILAAIEPDLVGSMIEYWSAAARLAAFRSRVPVAIMLDHAATAGLCVRCADAGFSGVMLDASSRPFDENIAAVREVAGLMHRRGVSVEAELGHVGDAQAVGGEGELTGNAGAHNVYTDPASVAEFVERSGCDALAVSIGTAHGVYVTAPQTRNRPAPGNRRRFPCSAGIARRLRHPGGSVARRDRQRHCENQHLFGGDACLAQNHARRTGRRPEPLLLGRDRLRETGSGDPRSDARQNPPVRQQSQITGECLRRPGALRPPVPPTGKVPAPGSVLNFYCVKITKPGVLITGWVSSTSGTCPRVLPGRVARAKRLAHRRHLCAQRPAAGA